MSTGPAWESQSDSFRDRIAEQLRRDRDAQELFDAEEQEFRDSLDDPDLAVSDREATEVDLSSFAELRATADRVRFDLQSIVDLASWRDRWARRQLFGDICRHVTVDGLGRHIRSRLSEEQAVVPWVFEDEDHCQQHLEFCPYCRTVLRLATGRVRKRRLGRLPWGDRVLEEYVDDACRVALRLGRSASESLAAVAVPNVTVALDAAEETRDIDVAGLDEQAIEVLAQLGQDEQTDPSPLAGKVPMAQNGCLDGYVDVRRRLEAGDFGNLAEHLFNASIAPAAEFLFDLATTNRLSATTTRLTATARKAASQALAVCRHLPFHGATVALRRYLGSLSKIEAAVDSEYEALRDFFLTVGAYLAGQQLQPAHAVAEHGPRVLTRGHARTAGSKHLGTPRVRGAVRRAKRVVNARELTEKDEWFFLVVRAGDYARVVGPQLARRDETDIRIEFDLPPEQENSPWAAEVYFTQQQPEKIFAAGTGRSRMIGAEEPLVGRLDCHMG